MITLRPEEVVEIFPNQIGRLKNGFDDWEVKSLYIRCLSVLCFAMIYCECTVLELSRNLFLRVDYNRI